MPNIQAAGYIVCDNELIHGCGPTEDAAWNDALATFNQAGIALLTDEDDSWDEFGSWLRESSLRIRPATAALLAQVDAEGGDCGWRVVGGVCCCAVEEQEN